jgi:hypothetical protein
VEWARKGYELFNQSGVDSKYIGSIKHDLALAERDAGRPEIALTMFLDGRQLADVIDDEIAVFSRTSLLS